MINSRELLLKFSKLIGIPESESRSGFEIFIQQISKQMSLGDEIEVELLGFFAYKKVKPVTSCYNHYQQVIIFSTKRISQNSKNILLFFLPDESKKEFPHIDSYLNLSFGKPLVTPVKGLDEELFLQSSSNETIGLIDSKVEKLISDVNIYKSSNIEDQEFIIAPKLEEEIVFDKGIDNESNVEIDEPEVNQELEIEKELGVAKELEIKKELDSQIIQEEKKIIKTFDDFELIKTENIDSLDDETGDGDNKSKIFFDDLKLEDELAEQKENFETKDGYTEVTDQVLKSTISASESTYPDSEKEELPLSKFRPKKKSMKRLVFSTLALLFIAAASAGVYLNYDQVKEIIDRYILNRPQAVETKEKITPKIISRTYEIPVSFPYEKGQSILSSIEDSMLISPSVYAVKYNLSDVGGGEVVLDQNAAIENTSDLLEIGENIYKRGSEFVVQVSSWKSKSKADKELNKYIENGFHAEMIEETTSRLGKYHRIMIGGFNSIEDANSFLNKNK
jgi:hypothetical protein